MVEPATVAPRRSPTPRKSLPRIFQIFVGLAVLVAIAAGAAPWAFSNAALRNEIALQIRRITGLAAVSQGRAVFVVLPEPHISIDDVSFADPSGALRVSARYLKGYLRIAPLLAGRIELTSATLGQPEMHIDLDGRPMQPDSRIGRAADAATATPEAAAADEERLGVVTLVNGSARLISKSFKSDVLIDAINMTLDWRKLGAAANVIGKARVRGETATIAAWIAKPVELLRGQQSRMALKIDAPLLSLATEGTLGSAPTWQYAGHIHAAASSVRELLEKAEYPIPLPGPFNGFDLTCDANIVAASAVLSGLRLQFDGNDFEGTLAFQADDKIPVLSGTLATNQLSLRPFLSALPSAIGHDGQWNQDPFNLKDLGWADVDLRISASHMLFSHFDIEDAAVSLMTNNRRLELNVAEAKAYQGTIRGRASFDLNDNTVNMRLGGALSGIDVAAFSFDALGWPEFAGSLTGTVNIESAGISMYELMHSLDGKAQIDVARGQLGGIDLDSALRRIDKSPLALLTNIHRGRTAFDRASFGLRFEKGVADIEDGKLENPSLTLGFGGTVDFGERALDLHAAAMPSVDEAKPGEEAPKFRFDVAGSWDDLAFAPDVRSLIRRSGAAAPLFLQKPTKHVAPEGEVQP